MSSLIRAILIAANRHEIGEVVTLPVTEAAYLIQIQKARVCSESARYRQRLTVLAANATLAGRAAKWLLPQLPTLPGETTR